MWSDKKKVTAHWKLTCAVNTTCIHAFWITETTLTTREHFKKLSDQFTYSNTAQLPLLLFGIREFQWGWKVKGPMTSRSVVVGDSTYPPQGGESGGRAEVEIVEEFGALGPLSKICYVTPRQRSDSVGDGSVCCWRLSDIYLHLKRVKWNQFRVRQVSCLYIYTYI